MIINFFNSHWPFSFTLAFLGIGFCFFGCNSSGKKEALDRPEITLFLEAEYSGPIIASSVGEDLKTSGCYFVRADTVEMGKPRKIGAIKIVMGDRSYRKLPLELLYIDGSNDELVGFWGSTNISYGRHGRMAELLNSRGYSSDELVVFYFGTGKSARDFYNDENSGVDGAIEGALRDNDNGGAPP